MRSFRLFFIVQIAAHTSILDLVFLLACMMLGISTATCVRIAHYLGASQPWAARRVCILSYCISAIAGSITSALLVGLRGQIGYIFSSDEQVISEIRNIAILVGGAFAGLSLFYSSMSTLDGSARPTAVAISFVIGAWLCSVPLSYIFAFQLNQGLIGLWYGLCIGYTVTSLLTLFQVIRSDWIKLSEDALKRAERNKKLGKNENENENENENNDSTEDYNHSNSKDSQIVPQIIKTESTLINNNGMTDSEDVDQYSLFPQSLGTNVPITNTIQKVEQRILEFQQTIADP